MASDSLVHGYAEALFRIVQAEGELDRVEDELYRFGKLLESNHELKQALSDKSIDRAARLNILDDLLSDKVSSHTLGLLSFVVEQGRARQLPQILEEVSGLAAEARQSVVAEVRTRGSPRRQAAKVKWPTRSRRRPARKSRSRTSSTHRWSAASWPKSEKQSSTARCAVAWSN